MYVIPLLIIVLIALAIFVSPILSVILLVVFLVGLGLFKYLGPGTEPEHAPRESQMKPAASPPQGQVKTSGEREREGGAWGETWPEQGSGEEPS